MNIEYMKPDELIPYAGNAKLHPADQVEHIANSIKMFGWTQPIVVDSDNVVVIGHGRLMAAKELRLDKVPVVRRDDLTEEQINACRLADNKTNESGWDFGKMEEELAQLAIDGIDMGQFGFEVGEDFIDHTQDIVEDEAPEVQEEAVSKIGQIYQLGRHRLMCGDSTDKSMVEKLMNGKKADILVTDPPYNVDYEGGTVEKLKIENDNMKDDEFHQLLVSAFQMADSAMKPGAAFYIWHADSEGYNFRSACREIGWNVRQCLIWNKNALVMGRQDYQWKHEPCLYGWKEGAAHTWNSDRKQTTVIDFDKPLKNDIHHTMKPVGLFDYLIKNSSKKGDIVLDMFGGSGTAIMACEQNERSCCMMELDPRYVDAIIKRWENFTGGKAVLLHDPE